MFYNILRKFVIQIDIYDKKYNLLYLKQKYLCFNGQYKITS